MAAPAPEPLDGSTWVDLAVSTTEEPEFRKLNERRIDKWRARRFPKQNDFDGHRHVWRLPHDAPLGLLRKWLPVCPAPERTDLRWTPYSFERYTAMMEAGGLWDPGNKFPGSWEQCWYVPPGFDLARFSTYIVQPELQARVQAAALVSSLASCPDADARDEAAARIAPEAPPPAASEAPEILGALASAAAGAAAAGAAAAGAASAGTASAGTASAGTASAGTASSAAAEADPCEAPASRSVIPLVTPPRKRPASPPAAADTQRAATPPLPLFPASEGVDDGGDPPLVKRQRAASL